ncbi:general substrate transporter [Dendryphion nanum]|uniref:General substrate transporter n=1 Tax=Dendryphion nanum TaxID=256645 RepID=A0A9P9E2M9_9PLEO|nr:general substrate transporter [Dendryphion nanum]
MAESKSCRSSAEKIEIHNQENVAKVHPVAVELVEAVAEQGQKFWSVSMLRIYSIMTVGYLISTIQGFDGSLMGAINAMKPFQKSFSLNGAGASTGLVFIIYNLAQIAAFPVCGFINDKYGRRACIFIGCVIVLIGTAIQGSAQNLGAFMGGRFVLGFGAVVAHAAAPAYVVELAPPAYRGITAGMYNNFWWIGNILAGWTTYGTNLHLKTSWAWRIPTIMQAALPSFAMIIVLFLPESPRWLISQDRSDEALAVLAKYHGEGDPNAHIVQLQYREILEEEAGHDEKLKWWDYRELVATRSARYRLALVIAVAFFGQWSGNNVVSYFMPAMISNAGITDTNTQLLINAINPILSWVAAMTGATILDKFGRRQMMMGGLTGALIWYCFLTAFTAESAKNQNLSYAVIVSIYMFGICFAMGMTPSATLYPMEVLPNRTRAKGSALKFVFLNIATMTNTYGVSVGIKKIGWKLYLVYIIWITVEIAVIYFFFVETSGKTLEELAVIFESSNPRKTSTKKIKVELDDNSRVVREVKEDPA